MTKRLTCDTKIEKKGHLMCEIEYTKGLTNKDIFGLYLILILVHLCLKVPKYYGPLTSGLWSESISMEY